MHRNPRKLGWTKAFRRAHGKEMTVDSTLALQARRNIPVRYDRDLLNETLSAMERISEIRQRRERRFYKARMQGNRQRQLDEDRKLVRENAHLLPPEERKGLDELLDEGKIPDGMEDVEEESEMEDLEDVDEEAEESMLRERELQGKEEKARQAARAVPAAKEKKKRTKLVVGQRPEGMDVD